MKVVFNVASVVELEKCGSSSQCFTVAGVFITLFSGQCLLTLYIRSVTRHSHSCYLSQ